MHVFKFTTLNNVNQKTFAYIASLSSDAQSQLDNVSLFTQYLKTCIDNVSTVANTALGSANSALALVNSVSLVAYTAFNNELALSETVTGVKQDVSKTNSSVNSALSSVNVLNTSVNNASVMLGLRMLQ